MDLNPYESPEESTPRPQRKEQSSANLDLLLMVAVAMFPWVAGFIALVVALASWTD
jgi:hypothetical protein